MTGIKIKELRIEDWTDKIVLSTWTGAKYNVTCSANGDLMIDEIRQGNPDEDKRWAKIKEVYMPILAKRGYYELTWRLYADFRNGKAFDADVLRRVYPEFYNFLMHNFETLGTLVVCREWGGVHVIGPVQYVNGELRWLCPSCGCSRPVMATWENVTEISYNNSEIRVHDFEDSLASICCGRCGDEIQFDTPQDRARVGEVISNLVLSKIERRGV